MIPQPLIAVRDVEVSSRWYQAVLGMHSGHGGRDYEQLLADGRMVLQLHRWDAHDHIHVGDPAHRCHGNGTVLWFQTDNFTAALLRIQVQDAQVLDGPKHNPNANHREIWLRDPDGYVVVIASAYGDKSE